MQDSVEACSIVFAFALLYSAHNSSEKKGLSSTGLMDKLTQAAVTKCVARIPGEFTNRCLDSILSRFLTRQATIYKMIFLLRDLDLSNKTFHRKFAFTNRFLTSNKTLL
jgi:hypothetical protein